MGASGAYSGGAGMFAHLHTRAPNKIAPVEIQNLDLVTACGAVAPLALAAVQGGGQGGERPSPLTLPGVQSGHQPNAPMALPST